MNCEQALVLLPEQPYLSSTQQRDLARHLADCAACAAVARELDGVRRLLDQAPMPAVRVDLAALYRRSAELDQRHARRWRRWALVATAAAAVVLLVLGLRVEFRWHDRELIVGWGVPPAPRREVVPAIVQRADVSPQLVAELQLVRELIHAVATDVEQRDRQGEERLAGLEKRLDEVATTSQLRWTATQKNVRALYTAYLEARDKGATP
jgi:hypothetical protein